MNWEKVWYGEIHFDSESGRVENINEKFNITFQPKSLNFTKKKTPKSYKVVIKVGGGVKSKMAISIIMML